MNPARNAVRGWSIYAQQRLKRESRAERCAGPVASGLLSSIVQPTAARQHSREPGTCSQIKQRRKAIEEGNNGLGGDRHRAVSAVNRAGGRVNNRETPNQ